MLDLVAIAQSSPGAIAVNSATFVGTRIAGPGGAVAATLGCILPSCIIVTLLAYIYTKYRKMFLSPGNSYIPSPGSCGHDRQGRSYHFSIILFYKWCSGTVSGKHMHSNGGVLYCRTGAFKKI